jgi:hypothetical protein
MNELIKGELKKLTPYQLIKFMELSGWQLKDNKGQTFMSDSALFKLMDWVKNLEEPVEETPCSDSPQK